MTQTKILDKLVAADIILDYSYDFGCLTLYFKNDHKLAIESIEDSGLIFDGY